MNFFVLFMAGCVVGKRIKCKENEWRKGKICKSLQGFALENNNLPDEAVDFASNFFADLDPKGGVWRRGEINEKLFCKNILLIISSFNQIYPVGRLSSRISLS